MTLPSEGIQKAIVYAALSGFFAIRIYRDFRKSGQTIADLKSELSEFWLMLKFFSPLVAFAIFAVVFLYCTWGMEDRHQIELIKTAIQESR